MLFKKNNNETSLIYKPRVNEAEKPALRILTFGFLQLYTSASGILTHANKIASAIIDEANSLYANDLLCVLYPHSYYNPSLSRDLPLMEKHHDVFVRVCGLLHLQPIDGKPFHCRNDVHSDIFVHLDFGKSDWVSISNKEPSTVILVIGSDKTVLGYANFSDFVSGKLHKNKLKPYQRLAFASSAIDNYGLKYGSQIRWQNLVTGITTIIPYLCSTNISGYELVTYTYGVVDAKGYPKQQYGSLDEFIANMSESYVVTQKEV